MLDFTAAAYVDGKALEVLKKLSQRIAEIRGASLMFENVNEDLEALLKLTHFDRLFTIRRSSTR